MLNALRKIVAVLVVATVPLAANAQLAVIDFNNLIQTTATATITIRSEIVRLKMLAEDIKQTMNMFGGKQLADMQAEYAKVMSVYNSAVGLQNSLVGARNNFDNIKSLFGSGRYQSFSQFANDINRRARAGDAVAKNLYENANNANRTMKKAYEYHEQIVNKADNVRGVTEATQATTAAIGVLIQQQNAMLAMMSSEQTSKSISKQEETTKREQEEGKLNLYYKSVEDELTKLRSN